VDEARLDINEGVPYAYEKRLIEIDFWEKGSLPAAEIGGNEEVKVPPPKRAVEMLVYIDFQRKSGDGNKPKEEYVHRMNEGIRDALREGVPARYIDSVLRAYIPVEKDADEGAKELALKQAVAFIDESGVFVRTGSGVGGVGPVSK